MRKITLLTAGILTFACLGGQTLTVDAASIKEAQVIRNGNRIIVISGNNYDSDNILEQIKDRLNAFCNPNLPDNTLPDNNITGDNTPDTDDNNSDNNNSNNNSGSEASNQPGSGNQNTNKPGNSDSGSDTQTPAAPGTGNQGSNKPESSLPENNTSGTNKPGANKPDTDNSGSSDNTAEDSTSLSYAEQVVKLVNEERAKEGLSPLSIDKRAAAAALVRAQECEQSFSHTRPDGSSFSTALKEQNITYRRAGENIAWGQRSPEEVVNAWMNSEGHRANIMNANFTSIGVGYYQNSRGVNYWAQLFIG